MTLNYQTTTKPRFCCEMFLFLVICWLMWSHVSVVGEVDVICVELVVEGKVGGGE